MAAIVAVALLTQGGRQYLPAIPINEYQHVMSNPATATVAWYSVYSLGAGDGEFGASDLTAGDQVNALGRAWLNYAAGGRVLRGD